MIVIRDEFCQRLRSIAQHTKDLKYILHDQCDKVESYQTHGVEGLDTDEIQSLIKSGLSLIGTCYLEYRAHKDALKRLRKDLAEFDERNRHYTSDPKAPKAA